MTPEPPQTPTPQDPDPPTTPAPPPADTTPTLAELARRADALAAAVRRHLGGRS